MPYLEKLRFHSSATAARPASATPARCPTAVSEGDRGQRPGRRRRCCRGNRNFEGRINPEVRANYLMSPPLVVAYALAGRIDIDLDNEPLGKGKDGKPVYPARHLADARSEVERRRAQVGHAGDVPARATRDVFEGDERWRELRRPDGRDLRVGRDVDLHQAAAVLRRHDARRRRRSTDIKGARVLAVLGDSVTTDHISPAGSIKKDSPAGQVPDRARRQAGRTSTPTARAAATTR